MKNLLTNNIFINGYANSESFKFLYSRDIANPLNSFSTDGSDLTIVILSYNRVSFTLRLIDSVLRHIPGFKGEILIMDNGSDPLQIKELETKADSINSIRIRIVKLDRNYGVAGGRNKAVEYISTEWFMSLDNDIYLVNNPLAAIKTCIETLGVQFLNVPLLQPDGFTIDAFGGNLWLEAYEDSYFISGTSTFRQIPLNNFPKMEAFLSTFLFGGASVINKKAFVEHDCYDANMFIGFEDTELSLRLLKKGIKIGNATTFSFIHAHEAPKTTVDVEAEKVRFSSNHIRDSGEYFKKKHGLIVWLPSVDQWIKDRFNELKIDGSETRVLLETENIVTVVDHTPESAPIEIFLDAIDPARENSEAILNNKTVNDLQNSVYELQQKIKKQEYELNTIKSSKFWRVRELWFRQRRRFGFRDDGFSFTLRNLLEYRKNKTEIPSGKPYDYSFFVKNTSIQPSKNNVMVFIPFMVVGGAETAILQVLKGFKKNKINVTLIVSAHPPANSGDTSEHFYNVCPDTYVLEDYNTLWNDTDSWRHWKQLTYELIKIRKINTVIISNSSFAYVLLKDLKQDFPHISVINPVYSTVGHMVDNIKYEQYIDLTVVENPLVEKYLVTEANREPQKVKRIENGVDTIKFTKAGKPELSINGFEIPPQKKIVTFLGRLSEEKGPDLFVKIASSLRDRDDLHFILAGDGPMSKEILDLISSENISNKICFTGFADSKKVLEITDLLILPSRMDGRPNNVLESLSMGVPVICSNVGGLPWIINEKNRTGVLCAAGDIEAFRNAIINLAENDALLKSRKESTRAYAVSQLCVSHMQAGYSNIVRKSTIKTEQTT